MSYLRNESYMYVVVLVMQLCNFSNCIIKNHLHVCTVVYTTREPVLQIYTVRMYTMCRAVAVSECFLVASGSVDKRMSLLQHLQPLQPRSSLSTPQQIAIGK